MVLAVVYAWFMAASGANCLDPTSCQLRLLFLGPTFREPAHVGARELTDTSSRLIVLRG